MMLPDLISKESSNSFRSYCIICWKSINQFAQPINNNHNCIIPLTLWQSSNQIYSDDLPYTLWNFSRHKLTRWFSRVCFGSVTSITALNILSHISSYTRPPIIPRHQLKCLPSTRMTSNCRVMMILNYLPSKIFILWYIDCQGPTPDFLF